jgi:hypothetical protein
MSVFLLDVAEPTSEVGIAGLIILLVVILMITAALLAGFVLLLVYLKRRKARVAQPATEGARFPESVQAKMPNQL